MKKMFLSLATIAFVATGALTATSCGSDDSTPNPDPVPEPLTENFIEIGSEKFPLNFTWLGFESDAAIEGEDVLEQALNPEDPSTLYVVWRFSTLTEDSNDPEAAVINWWVTEIDQTKTGWEDGRYKYPFTQDATTLRFQTVAIAADTQYNETASDALEFGLGDNFMYGENANINMTMTGTLDGVNVDMDIDHMLDMLYYIEVDASAAKGVNTKNISFEKSKASIKASSNLEITKNF